MPPVLHVALDELPRRGVHQLRAAEVGPHVEQRQHVLQLIAEPEGAAGLIRTAPRPDAARQRLIEQPAIDDQIERVVWRADLDRAEHLVPGALGRGERRARLLQRTHSATPARARAARSRPCPSTNATRRATRRARARARRAARRTGRAPRRCGRRAASRKSAAGALNVRLRPTNSPRSPVYDRAASVARQNDTLLANSAL